MSQFFALGSADWHGAPGAWKKHPELLGDSYFSMRQIAQLSEQYDIPVIGAGDLFDVKNPDSLSISEVIEIFGSLKNKVYIVQGQHEMADPPWLTTILPNAEWIHEKFLTLNGVACYGLDWVPPGDAPGFFERIPASTQLFITHQVWREMVMSQGNSVSLTELRGGLAVFSGDFHQTLETPYRSAKDGTYGRYISPGSICCQSIGEDPQKYVYLITRDLVFHKVPLITRKVARYEINTDDELEKFLLLDDQTLFGSDPNLPAGLKKPLIGVKYSSLLDRAYDKLIDRLTGKCFFDLTVVPPVLDQVYSWNIPGTENAAPQPYEMITEELLQSLAIPTQYVRGAQDLWQTPDGQIRSTINDILKDLEAQHANGSIKAEELLPAPGGDGG